MQNEEPRVILICRHCKKDFRAWKVSLKFCGEECKNAAEKREDEFSQRASQRLYEKYISGILAKPKEPPYSQKTKNLIRRLKIKVGMPLIKEKVKPLPIPVKKWSMDNIGAMPAFISVRKIVFENEY